VVYVSDQISKPGQEHYPPLIDGREGEGMDMKAHFVPGKMRQQDKKSSTGRDMEMLSYKQNQMYLYGEVDAGGSVVNQY